MKFQRHPILSAPVAGVVLSLLAAGVASARPAPSPTTVAVSNLGTATSGAQGSSMYFDANRGTSSGIDVGQSFTTGSVGTELKSVTFDFASGATGNGFSVSLYGSDSGWPSTRIATLTGNSTGAAIGTGLEQYLAPANTALLPSTTYWLVLTVTQSIAGATFPTKLTGDPTETSLLGWTLGNGHIERFVFDGSPNIWSSSTGSALKLEIGVADLAPVADVPEASTYAAGLALLGAVGGVWWRGRRA